jgi:thiamine biosynthesis lipoprotein ApbE
MRRLGWFLALGAVAFLAAACGDTKPMTQTSAAPKQTTTTTATTTKRCRVQAAADRRAMKKIKQDIARIRRATTHDDTSTATDRFIDDLNRSHISLKSKNRLIDFAVSASVGKCEDCFQALEAMRPIPSIAHSCG